jgi:uncharacterized protein YqjF (DUF2071 family)
VSARPWVMAQRWHDLLFMHWALEPSALAPLLPAPLVPELFDGRAWLGIVPFRMTGVRLRATPPLPWLSAFPELNVRTYVSLPGRDGTPRPGVWFFSLDAARWLAVQAARASFGLPYFQAAMRCEPDGEAIRYASRRRGEGVGAELAGRYEPAGPVRVTERGTLEHFLTARYCLYAVDRRGRLRRAEIDHAPWPLQPAVAEIERNTMTAPLGLRLPPVEPLLHFARRLEVRVWAPVPVALAGL